jgi:1,4-alpha-glucan branching enzyme
MRKGSLLLLLHAHLPYVRHPEHEYFLEEHWLYAAVVETYLPLLDMLERLSNDRVAFGLTLSLSPTLLEMLGDRHHKGRIERYIERLIELAGAEVSRNAKNHALLPLARMYMERARRSRELYAKRYGKDLVSAFRSLGESGHVELITTSATHAYLPNFAPYTGTVRRQIDVARANHEKHLGKVPRGFWLPECGYYKGLDAVLSDSGFGFLFLETHGVLHARPRPRHGVYMPVRSPSGPAAFGRDSETARLVWCAETGYPSDPSYREFHRDIGHDLPLEYIERYVHPDGVRMPTGIKYHRITGAPGEEKMPYDKGRALERAEFHAHDFVSNVNRLTKTLSRRYGFAPLVTAAFDAELFGHWWFEGIEWLEQVLRGLGESTVTPSEYLADAPELEAATPGLSSWGSGGYGRTWAERSNNWALRHLHRAAGLMEDIRQLETHDSLAERALRQAERELLLAQSSDWPFLMEKGASSVYAEERLAGHLDAFNTLYAMLKSGSIEARTLESLEQKNPVFPELGS